MANCRASSFLSRVPGLLSTSTSTRELWATAIGRSSVLLPQAEKVKVKQQGFVGSQRSQRYEEMLPSRPGSPWATLARSSMAPRSRSALLPIQHHGSPTKEGTSSTSNSGNLLSSKSRTGWHRIAQWPSHKPAFISFQWNPTIIMSLTNHHLQTHTRSARNATVHRWCKNEVSWKPKRLDEEYKLKTPQSHDDSSIQAWMKVLLF